MYSGSYLSCNITWYFVVLYTLAVVLLGVVWIEEHTCKRLWV